MDIMDVKGSKPADALGIFQEPSAKAVFEL
jgi:hypothetical protein